MPNFSLSPIVSYRIVGFIILLHALALGLVCSLGLHFLLSALLIVWILCSGAYYLYREWTHQGLQLIYRQQQWLLCTQAGETYPLEIHAETVVTGWFISLYAKAADKKIKLLFLKRDYAAADFKALARGLRLHSL